MSASARHFNRLQLSFRKDFTIAHRDLNKNHQSIPPWTHKHPSLKLDAATLVGCVLARIVKNRLERTKVWLCSSLSRTRSKTHRVDDKIVSQRQRMDRSPHISFSRRHRRNGELARRTLAGGWGGSAWVPFRLYGTEQFQTQCIEFRANEKR